METSCSSETSVEFQGITRRYVSEDRTLHSTGSLFDYFTIITTSYQLLWLDFSSESGAIWKKASVA
jgi:hypothetical protein